jgi:hypothetical protein
MSFWSLGRHWKYLRYVLIHKWYVFRAGCHLGIPWLALLHDNSKFKPDEWRWYARHFYAPDGSKQTWLGKDGFFVDPKNDTKFDRAWLKHIRRNKHHPQGTPDTLGWYAARGKNHPLGPETRAWIEARLGFTQTVCHRHVGRDPHCAVCTSC